MKLPIRVESGYLLYDADDACVGRCEQAEKVAQAINAFIPLKLSCQKALEVSNLPHGVRKHIEDALELAR